MTEVDEGKAEIIPEHNIVRLDVTMGDPIYHMHVEDTFAKLSAQVLL